MKTISVGGKKGKEARVSQQGKKPKHNNKNEEGRVRLVAVISAMTTTAHGADARYGDVPNCFENINIDNNTS